jgi:hypothetical protein
VFVPRLLIRSVGVADGLLASLSSIDLDLSPLPVPSLLRSKRDASYSETAAPAATAIPK